MTKIMYDYAQRYFVTCESPIRRVTPAIGDLLYDWGPFAPNDDINALYDMKLKSVLSDDEAFFLIVDINAVQCYMCNSWFIASLEACKQFADNVATAGYDPTHWDCGCLDKQLQQVEELYLEQEEMLAIGNTNHAANISVEIGEHPAYPAWKRAQIANAADVSTNEQGGLEQAF